MVARIDANGLEARLWPTSELCGKIRLVNRRNDSHNNVSPQAPVNLEAQTNQRVRKQKTDRQCAVVVEASDGRSFSKDLGAGRQRIGICGNYFGIGIDWSVSSTIRGSQSRRNLD